MESKKQTVKKSELIQTINMLKIERECVLRQDTPLCCRETLGCANCDLVQTSEDVISAYNHAIEILTRILNKAK